LLTGVACFSIFLFVSLSCVGSELESKKKHRKT